MKIFLTGASAGIGRACYELLGTTHNIVAPSSSEFSLADFAQVDSIDLTTFDCVINCAGTNVGAYQGWHKNSWSNQQNQVDVNFTGALLLAKQYTQQRSTGQFIYMTSNNIEDPIAYNIFYTASKAALRLSMRTLRKEFKDIIFTEICPGKTRTNMLKQNYQGFKSTQEIAEEYDRQCTLSAEQVAKTISLAIELKLDKITIFPHGQSDK